MARLNRSMSVTRSPLLMSKHLPNVTAKTKARRPTAKKCVTSTANTKPMSRARARGSSAPPQSPLPPTSRPPFPPPQGLRRGRSLLRNSRATAPHSALTTQSMQAGVTDGQEDRGSDSDSWSGYTELIDELLASPGRSRSVSRSNIKISAGGEDVPKNDLDDVDTAVELEKDLQYGAAAVAGNAAKSIEDSTTSRALAALAILCPPDVKIAELQLSELEQLLPNCYGSSEPNSSKLKKALVVVPSLPSFTHSSLLVFIVDPCLRELWPFRIAEHGTSDQQFDDDIDIRQIQGLMCNKSSSDVAQKRVHPIRRLLCPDDKKGVLLFAVAVYMLSTQQEEINETIDYDLWDKILSFVSLHGNNKDDTSVSSTFLPSHLVCETEDTLAQATLPTSLNSVPQLKVQHRSLNTYCKLLEQRIKHFRAIHQLFHSLCCSHAADETHSQSRSELLSDFSMTITSTIAEHTAKFAGVILHHGFKDYISVMRATLSSVQQLLSLDALLEELDRTVRELEALTQRAKKGIETIEGILEQKKLEVQQELEAARARLREFDEEAMRDE